MIIEEIKNIKSEKSDLKKFGFLIGMVLLLASSYLLWKEQYGYAIGGFVVGAVFIVLGFILPSVLKPLQKAWMAFAVVMGFVMTKIIMVIVFYAMVTPIGLLGRLGGKKFLDLKIERGVASYWIKRPPAEMEKSNYERQF